MTPSPAPLDATLDACDAVSLRAALRDLKHAVRAGSAAAPALLPERLGDPEFLREHGVEWVVLAGFMRIVTRVLLDAFPMRVVNIHPALLPAFPGVDAQKQALDHGVRVTGVTVHFVDSGTDTGPIIAQRALDVLPGDDVESLKKRLLEVEHALLPEVLQAIAEGRVELVTGQGRARVVVRSPLLSS